MEDKQKGQTRREFLTGAGAIVVGGVVGGVIGATVWGGDGETTVTQTTTVGGAGTTVTTTVGGAGSTVTTTQTQTQTVTVPGGDGVEVWYTHGSPEMTTAPTSTGYLVHDLDKCANCRNCMIACSTVHEGVGNLSLARRQVVSDCFRGIRYDTLHADCRQCVWPSCVEACPTGALHVDTDNGNVRTVDRSLCEGHQFCIDACPYVPSRPVWNHEATNALGQMGVAMTCDLCKYAPYWGETGGVNGTQACVVVCPLSVIRMVRTPPDQRDNTSYTVDLKTENWYATLDVPTRYGEAARGGLGMMGPGYFPASGGMNSPDFENPDYRKPFGGGDYGEGARPSIYGRY